MRILCWGQRALCANKRMSSDISISTNAAVNFRRRVLAWRRPLMPDPNLPTPPTRSFMKWLVPGIILLAAAAIVVLITGNWNRWTADRETQETDDAYIRADLTPLSTKAAGLVAKVDVSDYQAVKSGDLLIELKDDDFQAQVREAEAAVTAAQDALRYNDRQDHLQDTKITQANDGIR